MSGFYVCSDCGGRNAQPGACSACGEGPVLDGRRPEVRDELWKSQELMIRKKERRLLPLVILGVSVPCLGAVAMYNQTLFLGLVFSPLGSLMTAGSLAVISFAVWRAVCKAFPVKRTFDWLSELR